MPPFCAEHGMHHRYYGEHDDMRDAAAAAHKDAERRDRAEAIAAAVIADNYGDATPGALDPLEALASAIRQRRINAGEIQHMLTAAALQALTDKENAQ